MNPQSTISDTARAMLIAAAERADHIAVPPDRLPIAARRSVVQSLLKAGLIEEVVAGADQPGWRLDDQGARFALRVTAAGLNVIGNASTDPATGAAAPSLTRQEPDETDASSSRTSHSPLASSIGVGVRPTVRAAAQDILAAWDDTDPTRPAMPDAIAALRTALASVRPARRSSNVSRQPRPDTKRAQVLALLRRAEGATVAQVAEATGWATHTVRGFFAGLKKAGTPVEVLERVRQIGPGNEGAKGSYTIYRIVEAG